MKGKTGGRGETKIFAVKETATWKKSLNRAGRNGQIREPFHTLGSQPTPYGKRDQGHLFRIICSPPFKELKGAKAFFYYRPMIHIAPTGNHAPLMKYL